MDIFYKDAAELSSMLSKGEISSLELTKAVIERTDSVEPKVGAFLFQDPEDALEMAKKSDERRAKGETLGALDGIPVSLKEIVAAEDKPLTNTSKMLEHYESP